MIRLILFLASTILVSHHIYASPKTDLVNSLYRYLLNSNSSDEDKLKLFQALRGDTISFNFNGVTHITNFSTIEPDTIWLKSRPKKKAKEGKHFKLSHIYKGVDDGNGGFHTPISEINNKPFSVLSVSASNFYSYKTYTLQLVDIENLDVITCVIHQSFDYNITITSNKINHIIASLIGETFYLRTSSKYTSLKTFAKTKFIGGDYYIYLGADKRKRNLVITPTLDLNFISDNGDRIPFTPQNIHSNNYEHDKILSKTEYLQYIETFTPKKITYANNDSTHLNIKLPFIYKPIWGTTNKEAKISQELDPGKTRIYKSLLTGYKSIPKETDIIIAQKFTFNNQDFYIATLNGKAFYISTLDVDIHQDSKSTLDSLSLCNKNQLNYVFQFALSTSSEIYHNAVEGIKREMGTFAKYGLTIPYFSVYSNRTYSHTDLSVEFHNHSKKRIKYITINVLGFNAVNDPVSQNGKYIISLKCIGPIEPDKSGSYSFDYVWHTHIVDSAIIKSIKVQYFDGSIKTYTDTQKIMIPDELKTRQSSLHDPVELLY